MQPETLSAQDFQTRYGSASSTKTSSSQGETISADQFSQRYGASAKKSVPKEPGALAGFAKSIFSAPATIAARPFQAASDLGDYLGTEIERKAAVDRGQPAEATAILSADADRRKIKETTSSGPGGIIAPIPVTGKDLVKDVGRAAQTVALGTGAPIAGGALFGVGSSLEQGNDLLSVDTAFNTALGAAGGKVLGLVGKPLVNAAGKVVGTITPLILQDIAARGTEAIQKFAAEHQLLGGIAEKPANFVSKGLQKVDDTINSGVRSAASATGNVLKEQFPAFDAVKHYTGVNERDILRPTTVNKPAYAKATGIFNKAKNQGIDLNKVVTEQGVLHHNIADGTNYNTSDTVDALRDAVYSAGGEKARPAIKIASYETPRVSNEQIHGAMRKNIHDLPATEADAEEKQAMLDAIDKRYGPDSASARAHPDGLNLTDLHDNRIRAGKNGKYIPGVSDLPTTAKAKLSRLEEKVFKTTFDRSAPKELKIDEFRKESQKILTLADYLESLHGKRVPEGITKKAVRLFGRAVTATAGGKIGGFPGAILGAQYGDMLFSTFEAFPSPVKVKILNSLRQDEPAAFKAIVDYIGVKEAERLLQKALPPIGGSSFKEVPPTIFTTPKGKSTPIKSEAFDVAATESGKVNKPGTDRRLKSYLNKVDQAQSDSGAQYTPEKDLPTIKYGKRPKSKKSLNDIKM